MHCNPWLNDWLPAPAHCGSTARFYPPPTCPLLLVSLIHRKCRHSRVSEGHTSWQALKSQLHTSHAKAQKGQAKSKPRHEMQQPAASVPGTTLPDSSTRLTMQKASCRERSISSSM